jgi:hypothetical protein
MVNKFEKDTLVVHTGVSGRKFKILRQEGISQYWILDMNTGEQFLEPSYYLLDLIDSRNNLINYLIDEK